MAATRMMSIHVNKGKTARQCIAARLDYIMNPQKTDDGILISTYACSPETAADEFMLFRQEYQANTGRTHENEVIAYHVRQSFRPGEINPEKANDIGKKLAKRITGGNHAFVVATHIDKRHIHNHIIICSSPMDGTHKYRDVKYSSKDLMHMSDELCKKNGLSIVQDPEGKTVSYDKWLGSKKEITGRDFLRMTIDAALRIPPDGFEALMQMMEEAGCRIKRGAHISMKPPEGKRFIRLDSLGPEYSEDNLRKTLEGHHVHIPKVPRSQYTESQIKKLIDIEAKLRAGKGKGYMIWAERNNIDAKAQSIIYLKENQIHSVQELEDQIQALRSERNRLHASIREKQNKMKEINQLRQAIRDYRRTKEVYSQYKASGWSSKFYQEHREEIEAHKNAQAVYSSIQGNMPTLKELSCEYEALRLVKESDIAAIENIKPKLTALNHIRFNVRILEQDYLPGEEIFHQADHPER